MKQLVCVLAVLLIGVGCGPAVRQATPTDKANLDRLAKEGIGAPGDAGKPPANQTPAQEGGAPGQVYEPKGGA